MRVVALGGAGGVGRHAVAVARTLPGVTHMVVADRDGEAARRVGEELGVVHTAVDVTDGPALHRVLSDADVVLNTVGPSYRFGVPILDAAIAAGCHYLDVCDDWEPTLEMLDRHDAARDAGVVAVIGLGASPGVSNLLARLAIEALDVPQEVFTGWDLSVAVPDAAGPSPSAATVHGLHQLSGTVRVWRDGRTVDEPPLQSLHLDVPGFGSGRVWTIGHPEAVTLPRTWPALRTSLNVMHAPWWHVVGVRGLAALIDSGRVSVRTAATWAERLEGPPPNPRALSEAIWARTRLPPLFAVARGERKGEPAVVSAVIAAFPEGGMGAATGIPLAMGLRLFHGEHVLQPGVWTPESTISPRPFLDGLAPHCGRSPDGFVELHRL
jgi:saccharopine dehydrogenase-like NADP-dependent oxidoreductase